MPRNNITQPPLKFRDLLHLLIEFYDYKKIKKYMDFFLTDHASYCKMTFINI